MPDKSICMKCLQLTRVWVKDDEDEKELRVCRVKEIEDLIYYEPTVIRCSQFIPDKFIK